MKNRVKILLFLIAVSISLSGYAQKDQKPPLFPVNGEVFHIDSMPTVIIDEVLISSRPSYKTRRKIRRYNKLVKKVKKVYPYAVIANQRMIDIENELVNVRGGRTRKQFIKDEEKKLIKEFEAKLVKLTFSEGRILIKLIDRQTGNTSYELIKEMRGSLSAFFWQSIAIMFGSNLKSEYDPQEEDIMIENIIVRIENNDL